MSFTSEIGAELLALPLKKNCCRKAVLLGLLMGAKIEESGRLTARYYLEGTWNLAMELLRKLFRVESEGTRTVRAGREYWELSFLARPNQGVAAFLQALDAGEVTALHTVAGFRCASCQSEFLRGVFLSSATVNDPHKGYHMELILPTEGRCDALRVFLEHQLSRPGKVKRGDRFGLYYKSNVAIGDFLYYIGGSSASFDVANVWIERDIRNNENRAINCVARNISRSVDASKRHREAIEALYETRRIDTLCEELRYTARLRLENPASSLSELALMHEPPISKSGLNRRLCKLLEEYEEMKDHEKLS